jgi:hypothetical protein
VVGDEIGNNTGGGVMIMAGQMELIGTPTAGNMIAGNGHDGLFVKGDAATTEIMGNTIISSNGDGVELVKAKRVTIGGSTSGAGNPIIANQGYGLLAYGSCSGSLVQANLIAANAKGNVNLSKSRGITYIPA